VTASRINKTIATISMADPTWFVKACCPQSYLAASIFEAGASESLPLPGAKLLREIEELAYRRPSTAEPQRRFLLFLPYGLGYIRTLLGNRYADLIAASLWSMESRRVAAFASIAEGVLAGLALANVVSAWVLRTLVQLKRLLAIHVGLALNERLSSRQRLEPCR